MSALKRHSESRLILNRAVIELFGTVEGRFDRLSDRSGVYPVAEPVEASEAQQKFA
jgi:hypothetical protein